MEAKQIDFKAVHDSFTAIKDAGGALVEVTERLYFDALGSVPPLYLCDVHINTYAIDGDTQGRKVAQAFAMGEVLRHDKEGAVYYCFFSSAGRWFARLSNLEEVRDKEAYRAQGMNAPTLARGTSDGVFMWVQRNCHYSHELARKVQYFIGYM